MRSSIACIRCRRSKVKCVNNGVGTTCRSCEHSGRECLYPSPVTNGGVRRRDSLQGRPDQQYGEPAKRVRKTAQPAPANPAPRESPRAATDALDPALLTVQVWQELFDIFQIHYSTELPFIHPPTFLKPLRFAGSQKLSASTDAQSAVRPPASNEFLLAFLALTARFHPKLVAHHDTAIPPRTSNPQVASEFYARAANESMASIWFDNRTHDLERTQAALMLGLYEWSMCRGAKAWIIVGMAIRTAQAMGLQYERDLDDLPMSRSVAANAEAESSGPGGFGRSSISASGSSSDLNFIQQEIRRRTFWSCFILDRYLSCGKYRPKMLHAAELRVQLPASDRSFVFAEKVRTLMLGEDDKNSHGPCRADLQNQRRRSVLIGAKGTPESLGAISPHDDSARNGHDDRDRLESGANEGLISKYIKMLELYGKVVKWSCMGGRSVEEYPPWDQRSGFAQLVRQCEDFRLSLPRQEALTAQNTQAHISVKTSTPYVLVHAVYLLCQIMLHREYLPFVPYRSPKPDGPLDSPNFPSDKYDVPAGFWEESARICFRSARAVVDLVQTCQEWNAMVETPIVGFAIYAACFVGIYAVHFPWMDPEGYMCTLQESEGNPFHSRSRFVEVKGVEATRKALEAIGHMRSRLHMAQGWFDTINRLHRYLRRLRVEYHRNFDEIAPANGTQISRQTLFLRDLGCGGSVEEIQLIERMLKDLSTVDDEDVEMSGVQSTNDRPVIGDDDSSVDHTVKSEDLDQRLPPILDQPRSEGAWSAINAAPSSGESRNASIAAPSGGQFRSYDSYSQPSGPATPQTAIAPSTSPGLGGRNFRSSISEISSGQPGARPVLPPPAPHLNRSPSSATPQHPSRHASFSGWSQHASNITLPPPSQQSQTGTPAGGGGPSAFSSTYSSSTPQPSAAPSSTLPPFPYANSYHATAGASATTSPVNAWLDTIDTRLGGDDVAAFVHGGELAEWTSSATLHGYAGGWLSTIWSRNAAR